MLAVLLMIAVAVAAALITYAWVMTYLSSTTGRAGHAIQIQSVAFTGTEATVYAQNVGDGTVVITDAYMDQVKVVPTSGLGALAEGVTQPIVIGGTFAQGSEYHFKIVCEDGSFTEGTYAYN